MIVGWAGFICPPFQCVPVIPAWADKACPLDKIIILSISTSRLAARLFIFSNVGRRYVDAFRQHDWIEPKFALAVTRIDVNVRGFIAFIGVEMKSK